MHNKESELGQSMHLGLDEGDIIMTIAVAVCFVKIGFHRLKTSFD